MMGIGHLFLSEVNKIGEEGISALPLMPPAPIERTFPCGTKRNVRCWSYDVIVRRQQPLGLALDQSLLSLVKDGLVRVSAAS